MGQLAVCLAGLPLEAAEADDLGQQPAGKLEFRGRAGVRQSHVGRAVTPHLDHAHFVPRSDGRRVRVG